MNEGSEDDQKKESKLADVCAADDDQTNNQGQVLGQFIQQYRSRGREQRTARSTACEMIFGSATGFASHDSHSGPFRQ
jgi:hypothetical protein